MSRPIPGFPGYTVTADGVVYGKTGKALRPRAHRRTGHLRVRLYGDHLPPVRVKRKRGWGESRFADVYVHVLVCSAFHGPRPFEAALVLHHDDVSTNNTARNLRWGSRHDNAADRRRNSVDRQGFDWSTGRPSTAKRRAA